MSYTVIAFYKFVKLDDLATLRQSLKNFCACHNLCGSILLAPEGINATVAGARQDVDELIRCLNTDERFQGIVFKTSYATEQPFYKLKVRLKKEIITFGGEADPSEGVGAYVKPSEWNALISDPAVMALDTRNTYEVKLGTFAQAVDPAIESFTEFKAFVNDKLDPEKHKHVAMFCTGGIRCEKATAYLLKRGFENVYHLEGGILKYLEEIPRDGSLFRGECYVFDKRISLKDGLVQGSYELLPHTDNEYIRKG